MGGFPGVSFHAVVQGDHSRLPDISPLVELRPGGEQIFLNVREKTVLLRIEVAPHTAGEPAVREFLRTLTFPP